MEPLADILREIIRETRAFDSAYDRRIQELAIRGLGFLAATAQPAAAEAPDARDAEIEQLKDALDQIARSCDRWSQSQVATIGEANVHRQHAQMARAALSSAPAPREGAADA